MFLNLDSYVVAFVHIREWRQYCLGIKKNTKEIVLNMSALSNLKMLKNNKLSIYACICIFMRTAILQTVKRHEAHDQKYPRFVLII